MYFCCVLFGDVVKIELNTFIVRAKLATYVGGGEKASSGRSCSHDQIDGARGAQTIQQALSAMYAEGRFLGGWRHGRYVDSSSGDVARFKGLEEIYVDEVIAYALDYHGGFVKP